MRVYCFILGKFINNLLIDIGLPIFIKIDRVSKNTGRKRNRRPILVCFATLVERYASELYSGHPDEGNPLKIANLRRKSRQFLGQ